MGRNPQPVLQDLVRFAAIGAYLSKPNPPTLKKIAEELGVSPPTIQAVLRRLEDHLDSALILTSKGVGAESVLTDDGKQYLEEIQKLLHWRPASRAEIRLALAHSLLTSRILSSSIYEYQALRKQKIRIDMGTVTIEFHQLIHDLQVGNLDVVIVWSSESRYKKEKIYPGIDVGEFSSVFDIVAVSRDSELLPNETSKLSYLSQYRVITLRPDILTDDIKDILPVPNGAQGGERIFADTFDAVISCVISGSCDVGIVVANYFDLDVLWHERKIFYSHPIGEAKLMWLKRSGKNKQSDDLITAVEKNLSETLHKITPVKFTQIASFPFDQSFYLNFKHGYYVELAKSPNSNRSVSGLTQWQWEKLCLEAYPEDGHSLSFRGISINSHDERFRIRVKIDGRLAVVHAELVVPNGTSDISYICAFNSHVYSNGNNLLYGIWKRNIASDDQPALFGAIWSWNSLTFLELKEIAQALRARTSLDAEKGLMFDAQGAMECPSIPKDWWEAGSP